MTSIRPLNASNLVEVLRRRACEHPDRRAYTFLADGDGEQGFLTYRDADRKARAVAATLQEAGFSGERAVLLYPPGLDFIVAFFGCLYAGVTAVPMYPPRSPRNAGKLLNVIGDSDPRAVLTTANQSRRVGRLLSGSPAFAGRPLATDEIRDERAESWREPALDGETLAFLQYTSGSTSAPKGVMVSHANLVAQQESLRRAFRVSSSSVIVGWLPLYHDMGLIGNVLQPLYVGAHCVLMSPMAFLQRPRRWLESISSYRGTVSGGPNFAYELCVRKVAPEEREGLDLSSWEVAFNGAEPVRDETLRNFGDAYRPCGFRRRAFHPCYGLAEGTLMVSGPRPEELPAVLTVDRAALQEGRVVPRRASDRKEETHVGCGEVVGGQEVRIVDPGSRRPCDPERVGEIWVAGPSVTRGYWRRPDLSRETFACRLAPAEGSGEETSGGEGGPYLRTGDLGFLSNGQLFVTGRLKDLIILRGRNYYPQDFELTAESSHDDLRPGGAAAFSVEVAGEQRLVVVQEIRRHPKASPATLAEGVRRVVAESHDVHVHEVVLIRAGTLPKTSSGKVRRRACRAGYLAGNLQVESRTGPGEAAEAAMAESSPDRLRTSSGGDDLEEYLLARVAEVVGRRVSLQISPAAAGLDSLRAVELCHRLEADLGISMSLGRLLEASSWSAIAAAILELREAGEGSAVASPPEIAPQTPGREPLSAGQQGLLFLERLAPEAGAYNIAAAVRLEGHLDSEALSRALEAVTQRHPVLRTTFHEDDEGAWQRISREARVDLRREPAPEDGEPLQDRLCREAFRPFDLGAGPLLRLLLLEHSPERYTVLLVIHHLVSDLWSLDVFIAELQALYRQETGGPPAGLTSLGQCYGDYLRWQQDRLGGSRGERLQAYWRRQLAGGLPTLDLPTDRPRPAAQTHRGAAWKLRLAGDLADQVRELARTSETTLYTVLLAAFQGLLARHSRQDEIWVGSPVAGRTSVRWAGLMGYFVNPVVVRGNLAGDPAGSELVDQVKKTVLEALDHQDYPFPLLVDELQPVRDPARSSMFQALFVLQRTEGGKVAELALGESGVRFDFAGLTLESLGLRERRTQFDLTLAMAEAGGALTASFVYAADLFDASTVGRLAGHYRTLLKALAERPERPLGALSVLTASERHQLLAEWRSTDESPETARSLGEAWLHRDFEAQVELTPQAAAVICGDKAVSYRHLDELAGRLAGHLRALGLGPDVLAGVCLERSLDLVVALLAVLKAGGAYVPLDASYPKKRLAFMVRDTRMPVMLVQRSTRRLFEGFGGTTVSVDGGWNETVACPVSGPPSPDHLAYVIYTSGSTGRPKGVAITHRGAAALVDWGRRTFSPRELRGVLAATSVCFDLSVFELFVPLSCGGAVILARNALALPELPAAGRVSLVNTVPSAMAQLTATQGALPASVQTVNLAGEPLKRTLADQVYRRGVERLWNFYGPSEETVYSTGTPVAAQSPEKPTIGRPVRHTRACVLDRCGRPVPAGVPGELYLGGPGLARGYLRRPGLSAERFVPDPAGQEPGRRLYRTGDVVRHLRDGQLDFLGRLDNQVKIRGFRIELGEIEHLLERHPLVAEAVVTDHEDHRGATRLVAYWVAQTPGAHHGELRGFLETQLPDHMVPQAFVALESLPRTSNGKVDRKALPEPDAGRTRPACGLRRPATPAERILAEIWSELLDVEAIGGDDNFFELGGDSIVSLQVISRARSRGLSLTTEQFFKHQTLADLAAVASVAGPSQAEQGMLGGELPLTPIQHWFFEQDLADPHHWNQALWLSASGSLVPALLAEVWRRLIRHHDALRLRFGTKPSDSDSRPSDGAGGRIRWYQRYDDDQTETSPTTIDLSLLPAAQRPQARAAAVAAVQASLDLARGPLARAVLFHVGVQEPDRLLIVIHHLAVDGVSWRILLEDLETAYGQLAHGREISLPAKTSSFRQWARQLSEQARTPQIQEELERWTARSPESAPLPVCHRHGENLQASTAHVKVTLGAAETRELLRRAPASYRLEVPEILLTALVRACSTWIGESRLLVDIEGHGRVEPEPGTDLSRTVGWFTSIHPLELDLVGIDEPDVGLMAIKEQVRAVSRRGVGHGLLRYLAGDEKLGRSPRPEVVFNYLGQMDGMLGDSAFFRQAQIAEGSRSPRSRRRHLIEIDSAIRGGRLEVDWTYSLDLHRASVIENLAEELLSQLRILLDHCRSGFGYTPSDFPLADLDQEELDRLLAGEGRVEDLFPLSPMQRGMLLDTLRSQEPSECLEIVSCRLLGDLSPEAFRESWEAVVARHSALRASFLWEGLEEPLQLIREEVTIPWRYQDCRRLEPREQKEQMRAVAAEEQSTAFELSCAPLMRLRLIRTAEEEHRFFWSFHHLLLDGWSLPLVLKEVLAHYRARCHGEELRLAKPRPYRDFIEWHRRQDLAPAERFWRRELEDLRKLTLPERESASGDGAPGGGLKEEIQLSQATTGALESLARRHRLTLNTLVQGAWSVVLSRYCGAEEVVFGTIVSGRPAEIPGVESMIGMFVNTLPLRVRVLPDEPLIPWLEGLQERQAELRRFDYSPLPLIRAWSETPPDENLFETILGFENYPLEIPVEEVLAVDDLCLEEMTSFPLMAAAVPGASLTLQIVFNPRRFGPRAIRRLLGHFGHLLEAFSSDSGQRLRQVPMLSPAQSMQLLVEWNDTAASVPVGTGLYDFFEAQTERAPDATAVESEAGTLSYAELDRRATELAATLRRLGVGLEDFVGLCVERSPEMAVGILGILKAGGVYLPLDQELPRSRLKYLIEDAAPAVILTTKRTRTRLPAHASVEVDLSLEPTPSTGEPRGVAWPRPAAGNLAYAMYTSGSTGNPKGVLISHGALLNYVLAAKEAFALRGADRILQFSPVSFNVVLEELLPAWLSGAAVILRRGIEWLSCDDLHRLVAERRISGLELPAGFWHQWVRQLSEAGDRPPSSLRFVILGCEKPLPECVEAWRRFDVALINVFGLTETTITSTVHVVQGGARSEGHRSELPIGRPITNTCLYLLDQRQQPVPSGVAGELYIAGQGLGRGYLGQPGLTAQRFVPDPFDDGGRLYRTGDLARYRSGGELDFLGRIDHQLKMRGFRIEPGDIEAALQSHPGVRESAVAPRPNPAGGQRLVAYVVPTETAREIGREHGFGKSRKVELWPSQGDYHVYDQALYHAMTSDEVRNRAYRVAMERLVPGKVVVDVGTGADATLSRMCVAAGARKVYAIEVLDESYRKARAYVHELGLEEKIELVYGSSYDVELPEKADVCVSELIGTIGGAEGAVSILNDVWRLMKPGGVMIPWRCATRIAAVRLADRLLARPAMSERGAYYAEKVFEQMGRKFDLRLCLLNFTEAGLVSSSGHFEDLHFTGPIATSYSSEVELEIREDTRVDGLLLWVQVYTIGEEVVDVIKYSGCWSPMYFPVFSPAVEMKRGDVLRLECRVSPSAGNLLKPDYEVAGEWLRQGRVVEHVGWASPFRETSLGRNPFYAALFAEQPMAIERESRTKLSPEALRIHLERRLPAHMVPSSYMIVDELPLTRNGKIDRSALPDPEPLQQSVLAVPRDPAERALAAIWAEVLGLEQVGIDDNFFALGGDSILSLQVVAKSQRVGLRITPRQLFERPTIAGVLESAKVIPEPVRDQGTILGPAPLTPIQRWFFDQQIPSPQHWSMPLLLELRQPFSTATLAAALKNLVAHHDGLRLRFRRQGSEWRQFHAGIDERVPFSEVDLSALEDESRLHALTRVAARVQRFPGLTEDSLFRAVRFRSGRSEPDRLLLVAHHLVVDGVSWRILLEDLASACAQLTRREAVSLPPKTTAWKRWAERLAEHARSRVSEELPYWLGMGEDDLTPLPRSGQGPNLECSAAMVSVGLPEDSTRALLEEVPAAYRTEINDVLLAALERTLVSWTGGALLVEVEGHGREGIDDGVDLSRTVGWFTTIYPVRLEPSSAAAGPAAALKAMKERLRGIPNRGLGYGLLRYCTPADSAGELRRLPRPEVLFNYLGQLDLAFAESSPFSWCEEQRTGPTQDPLGRRSHLLEINAGIRRGCLRIDWTYSAHHHSQAQVEQLALEFRDCLAVLIDHCIQPGAGGYTPSDFPLSKLSQDTLDRLLAGRRDIDEIFPLSPMQQGMVFHVVTEPDQGMYFSQSIFELRGSVDAGTLRQAWREVTNRHPSLRTSFLWEELDEPVQVVDREVTLPWRQEDWRHLAPRDQLVLMEEYLRRDRENPPDLARPPLLRLALFRTGEETFRFVWSYFQGLLDGWSLPVVLRDLLSSYRALRRGEGVRLSASPSYRDYIAWLERRDLAEAEAWWRRTLAGFATPTPLPMVGTGGGDNTAAGEEYQEYEIRLDAALSSALEKLGKQRALTLNTVCQGAWALLLSRYSGERDVLFGATVAGRPPELPGVESTVGVFINTLPVRLSVAAQDPLAVWLAGLQSSQVEMRQYEHTPLVKVHAWSEVPNGVPLFDSILVFENYPIAEIPDAGGDDFVIEAPSNAARTNYPLTLVVTPGRELRLQLYCRSRAEDESGHRLLRHLRNLFAGMAGHPDRPADPLQLMTLPERQQLLVEWNDTPAGPVQEQPVHQLFEAQAKRTPEATALAFNGSGLTYLELNARAQAMARHLSALGVAPEVPVGICLDRSVEMVVAILGVLRAGGAYVPLDPTYPRDRLSFIARDARLAVVLTQGRWRPLFADFQGEIVDTNGSPESALRPRAALPPLRKRLDHLAYVIYTSGSTGRPKGVAVQHRGVAALLDWGRRTFSPEDLRGVLASTSINFDLSAFELFLPLATGGTVVLASDALSLPELPEAGKVTLVNTVPSAMAELVRTEGVPASVRVVNLAGEPLKRSLVDQIYRLDGIREVWNLYGPSEDTTYSTSSLVPRGASTEPTIGRPISRTRAYVVDRRAQPVPIGVPGELLIGGQGLARGYFDQPRLSAERFVPSPVSEQPGGRLYRTGDLVRYLPEGELEFLGRLDHQVKVRGFRIELREIEIALEQHAAIREAVVTVREDPPATRRLVAHLVADGAAPSVSELRDALKTGLPEFMVPSLYFFLPSLPLTPNGKVDRAAVGRRSLPAADLGRPELDTELAAPRTPTQRLLAQLWSETLGVEPIGIHDNFFELGGDSILSLQVAARAHRRALKIRPRQILTYPTIAELAAHIETSSPVLAEQGNVSGDVPLTPIQHWFFEQDLADSHHWNQHLLLASRETLDPGLMKQVSETLVEHHDALRLRFVRRDGVWRQHIAEREDSSVFCFIDLSSVPASEGAAAFEAALASLQASLNLSRGPLVRMACFRFGEAGSDRLFIAVHHLAVDGVSWRVLVDDLRTLYADLAAGVRPALPPKTTSFRQWSRALGDHARSEKLDAELSFWHRRYGEAVAPVPVDFVGGNNTEGSAAEVSVLLSAEETEKLLREVPKAFGAEIDEVLLAAVALAWKRWSGSRRLLVDLEGHGREEIVAGVDLSRTVGWFTTLYPVWLEVPDPASPDRLLDSVRVERRSIPNRGIGYGLLRYLRGRRPQGEPLPLPQSAEISFNYLGQLDRVLSDQASWRMAPEGAPAPRSPHARRAYLLDLSAQIGQGRLSVDLVYSENVHRRSSVAELARYLGEELRLLIARSSSAQAEGVRASDVVLSGLSANEIEEVFAEIEL